MTMGGYSAALAPTTPLALRIAALRNPGAPT